MTTEKTCFGYYCGSNGFIEHFLDGISTLGLSPEERSYVDHRFIPLVREAHNDAISRSWQFHVCVNAITIGAILVTTFTALGGSSRITLADETGLYWTVIVLGAVMAIANKWMYLFGIHKKYILTQRAKERYEAEGWHYIGAVGKYCRPHHERFGVFCERVEKIQAKSVKDMVSINATSANAATTDGVTPRYDDNATVISMGTPTPRTDVRKRAVFSIPAAKFGRPSSTSPPPTRQDQTIPNVQIQPADNIAPPRDTLQPPLSTS